MCTHALRALVLTFGRAPYATEPGVCHTVLDIAMSTLDSNVLFDTLRRGDRTEWQLLIQAEEELGGLYEELKSRVSSGVSLQFDSLQRPTNWNDSGVTTRTSPTNSAQRSKPPSPRATTKPRVRPISRPKRVSRNRRCDIAFGGPRRG